MSKMDGTETVPLASCREMHLWSLWWTAAGPRIPTACFFRALNSTFILTAPFKHGRSCFESSGLHTEKQSKPTSSNSSGGKHPARHLDSTSVGWKNSDSLVFKPLGRSRRFCSDSTKHNVFTSGLRKHKTYYVTLLLKWPVGNVKLPTEVRFKGCLLRVGALTESWKQKCWRHRGFQFIAPRRLFCDLFSGVIFSIHFFWGLGICMN